MPKTTTHTTKGLARKELLIDAALRLLHDKQPSEVSLQQVAEEARVPASSAYHFFSNSQEVWAACAERFGLKLLEAIASDYPEDCLGSWQELFSSAVDRGVAIYEANPVFCKIILGPHTPPEVKLSDRDNDAQTGAAFVETMERYFTVFKHPDLNEKMFYAIEIIDLFLSLSYIRHQALVPEMVQEGKSAAISYLELYLPKNLPSKKSEISHP